MTEKPPYQLAREFAQRIFDAGVAAAHPGDAIHRALRARGERLEIALDHSDIHTDKAAVRSEDWSRVHLIAFGKAACAMMQAALEIVPPRLLGDCVAVTNYENAVDVSGVSVIGSGHPLPDLNGQRGADRVADIAAQAQADELVLVLISGGGSALLPAPCKGISLENKIATTQLLLESGADIGQINTVRKHLSRLKGGGLTKLAHPAAVHALTLSDVIGDDASAIASGPTVADPTRFDDAFEIFQSRDIWHKLPDSVRHHIEGGRTGKVQESLKLGDPALDCAGYTMVGSNSRSLDAIDSAATRLGFETRIYSNALCGDAREQAARFVKAVEAELRSNANTPVALLAGGETTVNVVGNGDGGRNQEFALAFALAAGNLPARWVLLSGGTDGRDGPTDAAGGLTDPQSLARMKAAGSDPAALLDNNDAYHALQAAGDLLMTGATGTNVADLQIALLNTDYITV